MTGFRVVPLDRQGIAPRVISPKLRSQLNYFARPSGAEGVPELGEGEYWLAGDDVERWLSDGVIYLVSPLDTANMTEVELTEEQEEFLGWLRQQGVQHVRVDG